MNECVGVDVSKQHLDWVFGGEGKVKRVGLVAKLRRCEASLIIVESTGGYERAIGEALAKADLPVVYVVETFRTRGVFF
jgi:transposase